MARASAIGGEDFNRVFGHFRYPPPFLFLPSLRLGCRGGASINLSNRSMGALPNPCRTCPYMSTVILIEWWPCCSFTYTGNAPSINNKVAVPSKAHPKYVTHKFDSSRFQLSLQLLPYYRSNNPTAYLIQPRIPDNRISVDPQHFRIFLLCSWFQGGCDAGYSPALRSYRRALVYHSGRKRKALSRRASL
jgi:hypothetical protein